MARASSGGVGRSGRVLAVAAAVSWAAAASSAADAERRAILTDGAPAGELVGATVAASPTVAALVDELAANGTVIVVVELTGERFEAMGDLRLQAAAAGVRYLRIRVFAGLYRWKRMSILGHELQHAREVALASEVLDNAGLARLMRRIGRETYRGRFETTAATETAERVLHEIAFGADVHDRPDGGERSTHPRERQR